jgi:hypothetical protein
MMDIDQLLQKFCEAGADAMRRYAEISGEPPDELPEYFMPALIFDRLGSKNMTFTLETNFSKLAEWNKCARVRRGLPPQPLEERELLRLAEEVRRPRVDMVLYKDKLGCPKHELDIWCIIEFKRGGIDLPDLAKITKVLAHIDTCDYGVVCGCTRERHLEGYRAATLGTRDRWFESEMRPLLGDNKRYFFVARLFGRPEVQ